MRLAAAVILGLGLTIFSAGAQTTAENLVRMGMLVAAKPEEAPDFELRDTAGQKRSLSSFQGSLVLLNFWATWCGPCRFEMPSMERLYRELNDEGLEILAVNLQENRRQINRFADLNGLTYPLLMDSSGKVGRAYGARNLPMTFLIDREGRILAKIVGAREWDGSEGFLRDILEQGLQ